MAASWQGFLIGLDRRPIRRSACCALAAVAWVAAPLSPTSRAEARTVRIRLVTAPWLDWSGYALLVLWGLPAVLARAGYVSPVGTWLGFSALVLSLLWLLAWCWAPARRRSNT